MVTLVNFFNKFTEFACFVSSNAYCKHPNQKRFFCKLSSVGINSPIKDNRLC